MDTNILTEKCLVKNTTKIQRKKIIEMVRTLTESCEKSSKERGIKYFQKYINGECELNMVMDELLNDINNKVKE